MKILVVGENEQTSEEISGKLDIGSTGWEIFETSSATQCFRFLEENQVDVVLAELGYQEMDIGQLLQGVEARNPRTLRLIWSNEFEQDSMIGVVKPMHQLLSIFDPPERLLSALETSAALQETIQSTEVLDAIGREDCFPSLPADLARINDALESDCSTSKSVAREIAGDPAVAARVLQLANSAIFGFKAPIVELERAVGVIGAEMIRALVLSQSLFDTADNAQSAMVASIYDHSFDVAVMAKKECIERTCDSVEPDIAFMGGLLHDVGKIVLLNAFPDRWLPLATAQSHGGELPSLEMEEFGANHQGVGAYLLNRWGLPPSIVNIVAYHHRFDQNAQGSLAQQAVFAANQTCNGEECMDGSDPQGNETKEEIVSNWLNHLQNESHQSTC